LAMLTSLCGFVNSLGRCLAAGKNYFTVLPGGSKLTTVLVAKGDCVGNDCSR